MTEPFEETPVFDVKKSIENVISKTRHLVPKNTLERSERRNLLEEFNGLIENEFQPYLLKVFPQSLFPGKTTPKFVFLLESPSYYDYNGESGNIERLSELMAEWGIPETDIGIVFLVPFVVNKKQPAEERPNPEEFWELLFMRLDIISPKYVFGCAKFFARENFRNKDIGAVPNIGKDKIGKEKIEVKTISYGDNGIKRYWASIDHPFRLSANDEYAHRKFVTAVTPFCGHYKLTTQSVHSDVHKWMMFAKEKEDSVVAEPKKKARKVEKSIPRGGIENYFKKKE
jgi:hypothetical protein